ncbi:MAG: hypothetical protein IT446_05220 [Phycisphaerales bacterium]|nr:hypothetical protein [Phycisphaerales bacterium]
MRDRPARVLSIGQTGVPQGLGGGRIDWSFAKESAEVLAQLRRRDFEHVLAGRTIQDQPIWPVIRRVKAIRQRQKWSLIAPMLSRAEEIMARSLGVVRIFDSMPDSEAILELVAGSIVVDRLLMEEAMNPNEPHRQARPGLLQPQAV